MDRIQSTLYFLMLLPAWAGAQEITDRAGIELSAAKALWFQSGNAAGLAYEPLDKFNTLDAKYFYENGPFRRKQLGETVSDLRFDTQGALKAGKFYLWGHFQYDNISDRDNSYNTVLFDPFDERQIYSVADTVVSSWKRQVYDMEFKAALPIAGDRLFGGLHLRYTDRIAAKQNDPRAESYKYSIVLKPSLLFRAGGHAVGLNGFYSNIFERSTPTLSNGSEPQKVFILKGLGNYTNETVGSGGLSTLYYYIDTYGGSLQYELLSPVKVLAEGGILYHATDARESATQPLQMGHTDMRDISASLQALFGERLLHKISLSYLSTRTEGIEYTSIWNRDEGVWEVRMEVPMCNFTTRSASAAYDMFILSGNSCRWSLHADVEWTDKNDRYALPEASFACSNAAVHAGASRNFLLKNASVRLGVDAGYSTNLSGSYSYTGIHPDGAPARDWYPHDIRILTADYFKAGLSTDFSAKVSSGLHLGCSAGAAYLSSSDSLHRIYAHGGISLIF